MVTLASARSALDAGNPATAIAPSSEARPASLPDRRRRALFAFNGCFLRQTDGCHVRALQTFQSLIELGLDVTVYSVEGSGPWPWSDKEKAALTERFPGVRLVLERENPTLLWSARLRRLVASFGSAALRDRLLHWSCPGASPALDAIRAEGKIDLLVMNYGAGVAAINGLPRDSYTIVDTHDLTCLESIRNSRTLGLAPLLAFKKEVALLEACDMIWSISFAEAIFLSELLGTNHVRLLPPTVDLQEIPVDPSSDFDLLFIGSDNRWNSVGLLDFLRDFATWSAKPRLAVAGKVSLNAGVIEQAASLPEVTLLGFQPDLAGLYGRTRAAICPLAGTGTKIKLIEALAAGRPVFANSGAFRGLMPAYERCVFPLTEASVTRVLGDPDRFEDARSAALDYTRLSSLEAASAVMEADRLVGHGRQDRRD